MADLSVNRDITSFEWWKTIGVDVIAFVPVIDTFAKHMDEVAVGGKVFLKHGDS